MTTRAVGSMILVVSFSFPAFARQVGEPQASVEGVVVDSRTGDPLASVQVDLGGFGRPLRTVTTDASGRFGFDEAATLPLRTIRVEHARYTAESIRISRSSVGRPPEPARVVAMAEIGGVPRARRIQAGELVSLEIRMTASAILSGRILDEENRPIPNARVDLLVREYRPDGRRLLEPPAGTGPAMTNNEGDYVFDRVPPGEYYVRASRLAGGPASSNAEYDPRTATYFPGFRDLDRAAPLELQPGSNTLVNLTLSGAEGYSVHGRVDNPVFFGEPVTYAFFLTPRLTGGMTLADWQVPNYAESPDGDRFELRNVMPGEYDLYVRYQPRTSDRQRLQPNLGHQVVSVGDEDVEELVVSIEPNFEVEGQFVFRDVPTGAATLATRGARDWRILPDLMLDDARPWDFYVNGWLQMMSYSDDGVTQDDGTFQITGITRGRYRAGVMPHTMPGGFYLDSVRLGTANVTGIAFDIESPPAGPLVFELRGNGGRVEGIVVDESGAAVGSAHVALLPEPARRDDPGAYRVTRTDASGRFVISSGVRPAVYTAFAFRGIDPYTLMDSQVVSLIFSQGTAVIVAPGETENLELQLISVP